jgi:hypothetical protein
MLTLDTVSTIASTAMSTIVAVVALIFTYRQNVGWRPVALVTASSMSGTGGTWEFKLSLTVEFWNRRKYPVSIRSAKANISGVKLKNSSKTKMEDKQFVQNNT